jgi:carbon monoxide dehydrogenase subunit G
MEVRNSFELPGSRDAAWDVLLDVPRVIPCMPGAELVETVGDGAWKARLSTRLGPVSLGFDADVVRESVDEDARTVTLAATARERSGRGGAEARIVNRLEEEGGVTVAHVTTDLALTGAVARFGRQSLIQDVAAQMTAQFADNLRREMTGAGEPAPAPPRTAAASPPPPAAPAEAPSAARMIAGILLRSLIRRLEHLLQRVEARS